MYLTWSVCLAKKLVYRYAMQRLICYRGVKRGINYIRSPSAVCGDDTIYAAS